MAPNWLDFAALVSGHTPPRRREGSPFRYLELGCGMGFGLCLLAALYPEGRFLGIDFHPDHVAHARHLAEELGLENLRFQEADFLALRDDPSPLGFRAGESGIHHYVAAHGIATWVVEPVQRALLAVASASLLPGGLFYCSYNTFPGWLPITAYQQLVRLELQRGETTLPTEALNRSANGLKQLLGDPGTPTPLRRLLPSLPEELDDLGLDNVPYLLGEYANEGWQPLYVGEMHRRCAEHKLRPVATANLPELFEELLPEPLRSQVREEPNPLIRQTLIDLGTTRGFRRDIFARGSVRLSGDSWRRRLGALRLRRQEAPPRLNWTFKCSFGDLGVPDDICIRLEDALAKAPRSLGELSELLGQPTVEVVRLSALLLDDDRVGLDRGHAGLEAQAICDRVNARLLQRHAEGWPYGSLAAPTIGSGVNLQLIEALCCLAPGDGPLDEGAWRWLRQRLAELSSGQAAVAESSVDQGYAVPDEMLKQADNLLHSRLPDLLQLGVHLARFQPHRPGDGPHV